MGKLIGKFPKDNNRDVDVSRVKSFDDVQKVVEAYVKSAAAMAAAVPVRAAAGGGPAAGASPKWHIVPVTPDWHIIPDPIPGP